MTVGDWAAAYARYFDRLSPSSKDELRRLAHPDIRFVDPFNDVRGIDKVCAVFDHMFETTTNPRFATEPPLVAGDIAFIKWRFDCTIGTRFWRKPVRIDGITEVHFDAGGRITAHLDYWDAAGQLYEKLPLLGGLLRRIRKRLAVQG
jgi:limonene-1,2-epoxide hydrolase